MAVNYGEPTPIAGIIYFHIPGDGMVTGLDGKVTIPLGGFPVPLLETDYHALQGQLPSYDAVGRGIYHALRANPDCLFAEHFARMLQRGYPHFVSEMASHFLMLDKKDVDVAYLDRKINCLKVFALMEPGNPRFPLEIGMTYMDKGLALATLNTVTMSLYRAEEQLRRAVTLSPEDLTINHQLGEVSYLLGKYDEAFSCWRAILAGLESTEAVKMERRLARIEAGVLPKVPAVDYLEAIAGAFALHQRGEYEEAAAILLDVRDDEAFLEEFPIPEVLYILGMCCVNLGMPRHAEDYLRAALRANPEAVEALTALQEITG